MLPILKKVIPSRARGALKRSLRNMLGIADIERRLDGIEKTLFDLSPDIIPRPDDLNQSLHAFLAQNQIPGDLNLNISKNDVMYHHARYTNVAGYDMEKAYLPYLQVGLDMHRIVEKIVRHKFGGFENVTRLLDFAAGYGRITRFFVQAMGRERIWVSDIKARAVEFQIQEFGVHGFVSTEAPEDLNVPERFDCIFVASLFSHLPGVTFGRWLQRLCDLLTPEGVLIFTAYGTTSLPPEHQNPKEGIVYQLRNEEIFYTDDGALNTQSYGTSYITENYIRTVIEGLNFENKKFFRFPNPAAQDLYILSRNPADDFSRCFS